MNLRVAFFALLVASPAVAQSVQQSGTVTRGHVAVWNTSGVIADGGSSASSPITSLGVTNNGGCGIGINSALPTAGAYEQLCFGINAAGTGVISVQNYAGAAVPSITFNVAGAAQGFPVVTPLPVVVGNVACFAAVGGTLTDCGVSPSTNPIVIGTTPITGGTLNGVLYDNAGKVGNATTVNNGVLVTNGTGVPFASTTLPSGITIPSIGGYVHIWPPANTTPNSTIWNVVDSNALPVSTAGTTTFGFQEAINTAFSPYPNGCCNTGSNALTSLSWSGGTVTATVSGGHGYTASSVITLQVTGASPSGYNGIYTATVTSPTTFTYPLAVNPGTETVSGTVVGVTTQRDLYADGGYVGTTTPSFPGAQFINVYFGAVNFINPTFHSCEGCEFHFNGTQGTATFNPNDRGSGADSLFQIVDSRYWFTTIFGLSFTSPNMQRSAINIEEFNAGTSGFLIPSPSAGTNWSGNHISIRHFHDDTATTSLYLQEGNGAVSAAVLGNNIWELGFSIDGSNNPNLYVSYATGNTITMNVAGVTTGTTLQFKANACGNLAVLTTPNMANSAVVVLDDNDNTPNCQNNANVVILNGVIRGLVSGRSFRDTSYIRNVPTTGFTVSVTDNSFNTIIDPAGTLATGTLTLNAHPYDGQIVHVTFSQQVSALTLQATSGLTLAGQSSGVIGKGGEIWCIYRVINTTEYCAWNAGAAVVSSVSPTFSGTVTMPDGGTWGSGGINGSNIGATTAGTGRFSSVTSLAGITAGILGSAQGSLTILNSVTGTSVITNATNGGNVTLQTPNNSGTIAVGATSPITLGAANGQIGCATCLTANQTITLSGIVTGSGTTAITTSFGTFSSSTLAAALTDETGSGLAVFGTSPTFSGTVTGPDSGTWTSSGLRGLATLYVGSATGFSIATLNPAKTEVFGSDQAGSISIMRYLTPGGAGAFNIMAASRGTAPGTFSALQSGDGIGSFYFAGDTGANYSGLGAAISSVATANWTTSSSPANIIFQTTPTGSLGPTTALTLDSTQNATFAAQIFVANATSDSGLTDSTACLRTSNGQVLKGSGTLGICLGTSGAQFKTELKPMQAGIDEVTKLNLLNYRYRDGFGDNGERLQYGLTAQDVAEVMPDLVRYDDRGVAINFDIGALLPVALHAIQQLKAELEQLKRAR